MWPKHLIVYDTPTLEEYAAILNRDADNTNLKGYILMDKPKFVNWGYDFVIVAQSPRSMPQKICRTDRSEVVLSGIM